MLVSILQAFVSDSNLKQGLFSPISPSYLKIKLQRIRHLEAEIADMQKEIDRQKQEAVAAVERLERTKKWLGIIDQLIRY